MLRGVALLTLLAAGSPPLLAQGGPLAPLQGEPAARFAMPPELFEVSGLAWHPDGFLLAHDDEAGVIHRLDPETGRPVGRIGLGARFATGDYEGVVLLSDGSTAVTTSTGTLVRHDPPSGRVGSWSAGVERECEIEGLALLPRGDADAASGGDELVLACKRIHRGRDRGALYLLATSVAEPGASRLLVRVSSDELEAAGVDPPFWASAVEVVPQGYLVLSARNRVVVFVDRAGHLWGVHELPKRLHPQPEGITVDPRGRIWIADEGGGGDSGFLTRYDPPDMPSGSARR